MYGVIALNVAHASKKNNSPTRLDQCSYKGLGQKRMITTTKCIESELTRAIKPLWSMCLFRSRKPTRILYNLKPNFSNTVLNGPHQHNDLPLIYDHFRPSKYDPM